MSTSINLNIEDHCFGCVYFPPNLPETAYPADDYALLQQKNCSYDHEPGDEHCQSTRKTSCSVVDLENIDLENLNKRNLKPCI